MLDLAKKTKIDLKDYNAKQDIANRILMSDFSVSDVAILQEIIFSPLKISFKKLSRSLNMAEGQISSFLKKVAPSGLVSIQEDLIFVDKEMRKYFEFQIARFDDEFKPDMEFLQGLLKRVPIHVLPTWYSIPRTSNNIFESIVEKYLLSPQIYQRYLDEFFTDSGIASFIRDIFNAPDFKVSSSDLISKYNLTRHKFEEIMLQLEFNFVAVLCYEKQDDHWFEYVTPLHEWREYLRFIKKTEAPILLASDVKQRDNTPFAYIEEQSSLLKKKTPSNKLVMLKLADEKGTTKAGNEWLKETVENRSAALYRNPHNRPVNHPSDRLLREAEKSIKRVMHGEWVAFDDFIKGVTVPLSEHSVISLKRIGKLWKYTLPVYTEEEKALLKAAVFEWLYELGVVAIGDYQGRECFRVTAFGRFFFED